MKKVVLIIALLIPAISIAQNWQLLNPSYRYNYQTDTSAVISNTILVDSATVENGDSIFHLNRIARPLKDQGYDVYAITNLPQFLQRKAIKKANGFYYFTDTLSFCINPFLGLNDTWLFDTTNSITATIVQTENGNVLGVPDSLKTILLSSGDTIIISKGYGIIRFPNGFGQGHYYELKGVEGPDIGVNVPGFWEFFDFNVGDEFQYSGGTWQMYISDMYSRKIKILSKLISGDTIRYEASEYKWGLYQNTWVVPHEYEWYSSHGTQDIIFNNSSTGLYNAYNNQLISVTSYIPDLLFNYYCSDSVESYFLQIFNSDNGVLFKECYPSYYIHNDTSENYYLCGSGIKVIFKTGIGRVSCILNELEFWQGEELEGYVKNGDTVGTVSSIEELEQRYSQLAISVYPNPASDMLYIKTFGQYVSAEIVNITGRVVKTITSGGEINITDLKNGLYAIRIHTPKGVVTRKFVKE